jgi:EAL domain-containing protein (putative c-di-GMP-specific phosphodiesterase class I)
MGFPAEKLEIEITETLLMNRGSKGIEELKKMASIGVSLALDDFGTGYSSLSQLKQLPIHKLKIDRSFVSNIEADSNDQTIVETIIAMAQSLNMNTVAEGVETPGQQAFLLQQGCNSIQGFYRHRPAPAREIEALLRRKP